jgi:hypothetical protein
MRRTESVFQLKVSHQRAWGSFLMRFYVLLDIRLRPRAYLPGV